MLVKPITEEKSRYYHENSNSMNEVTKNVSDVRHNTVMTSSNQVSKLQLSVEYSFVFPVTMTQPPRKSTKIS